MDLTPAIPPDRAILVPAERRAAVLAVIRQAHSTLLLSLFRCNDKEIFGELKAAVDRGVDVEVLVTSRAKGGKKKLRKLWQRLQDTGATVSAYNDPVVKYHAKYQGRREARRRIGRSLAALERSAARPAQRTIRTSGGHPR